MVKFSISDDTSTFGFHDHVLLNPIKSIGVQLNRRRLYHRHGVDKGNPSMLHKIIEENSSLRIDFNWAFECPEMLQTVMDDCIADVAPKYNIGMNNIVSDLRCSWIGFVPLNVFERTVYEELSTYGMILFNNEVSSFQEDLMQHVVDHTLYKQHALTRDDRYRFGFMKSDCT